MDVSPKQLVSVAAGLIPFLEHDDANRALMGSNMQRQGVPLLVSEAPLVGTGLEGKVARDSHAVVVADGSRQGRLRHRRIRSSSRRTARCRRAARSSRHDPEAGVHVYELRKFMRSNAGTCINQKPIVKKGQQVKKGQVIADGPNTEQGELALGRNVLVAFMPWNGYNFEDAIIISEKVVKEDIYTSIHIDEFEIGARDTKLGPEEITRDIPNVGEEALAQPRPRRRHPRRRGSEARRHPRRQDHAEESETELAPEERLLRAIFGEKAADVKDTSLTVPSGTYGIVMDVKVSSRQRSCAREADADGDEAAAQGDRRKRTRRRRKSCTEQLTEALSNILLGEKIPLDVVNARDRRNHHPGQPQDHQDAAAQAGRASTITSRSIRRPIRNKIREIIAQLRTQVRRARTRARALDGSRRKRRRRRSRHHQAGARSSSPASASSPSATRWPAATATRASSPRIVPEEDMPFLADGTPVDIVLNPLGVPSRMNVGQVLETHLGVAAKALGFKVATPVFDGIPETKIREYLKDAKKVEGFTWVQENGKARLYDGRTGDTFDQEVVVGYIYMMKLGHLVADKIHARAVGPYSLVTQQPLGGKAQYGGQRFGEMEVWALEAYGAAYTLQELLTVKSDDVQGRTRIYESIVKGDNSLEAGTPESFNVLDQGNAVARPRRESRLAKPADQPPKPPPAFV